MFLRSAAALWSGGRAATAVALLLALAGMAGPRAASAHEGHDHGPKQAELPASVLPRATSAGEVFELVAIRKDEELLVFVDRVADNAPVTTATVNVNLGGEDVSAKLGTDGVYRVPAKSISEPGQHELVITVIDGDASDLLPATLDVPAKAAAPPVTVAPSAIETAKSRALQLIARLDGLTAGPVNSALAAAPQNVAAPARSLVERVGPSFVIAGLALTLILISLPLFRLRKLQAPAGSSTETAAPAAGPAPASTSAALILVSVFVSSTLALGQPGDAETSTAPPSTPPSTSIITTGDAPRRLSDGTVFVPKPTQRLLEVRTVAVKAAANRARQTLAGRVIANPNRSGVVQSSIGGRVTPSKNGFPTIGQAVKAGEILAYVTPAIPAIDTSDLTQAAGELDQEIDIVRNKFNRARRLLQQGFSTRAVVEQLELELKGLQKRRNALKPNQVQSETLTAPVDGLISTAKAVPGQVVAPNDVLFEIIDPSKLWVEAYVFDLTTPQQLYDPTVALQDGRSIPIRFVGRSLSLRQQSAILHFEMANAPAGLDVGMPVTVFAEAGEAMEAFILPKAAIVRASSGEDIVWRHEAPERFVAQPVKVAPFDGSRVRIEAGLQEGQRIVVQSAELINQVR
jgi:membrane fusion protein, heavy metal efflux system